MENKTYDNFIKTGEIDFNVLEAIADKIIKNNSLTEKELEIYTEKNSDIEEIISKRKELSDNIMKNMINSYNLELLDAPEFIGGKVFINKDGNALFAVKEGFHERVSFVPIITTKEDALKNLLVHFNNL